MQLYMYIILCERIRNIIYKLFKPETHTKSSRLDARGTHLLIYIGTLYKHVIYGVTSDFHTHTNRQPLKSTLLSISNEQIFGVNPPTDGGKKKSEIKQRPECFPALTETLVKHLTTLCIADAADAACIYKPTPPRKVCVIIYICSRHVYSSGATAGGGAFQLRAHPELSLCQLRKVGRVYIFARTSEGVARSRPPTFFSFLPIYYILENKQNK